MKPDEQQTFGSYIGRILIDGATPFLYRSAVRSLLGLPESRIGNTVVNKNLSLTGFTHAYPQWGTGFNLDSTYRDPLNPFTRHTQSEPFEQQIGGSGNAPKGQENVNIQRSQTPRKKHPDNRKVDIGFEHGPLGEGNILDALSNQSYKRNAEPPVSKDDVQIQPKKINVKKLKTQNPETKAENAAAAVDKCQVNIPGFTTSKQHYPAVAPTNNDEAQREVQLEKNTLPNRKTVSSTSSPGVTDQKKPVQKVVIRKTNEENETGDYVPVSRIIKDQTFHDRIIFSSENNNQLLSDFRIPVDSLPITGEVAVDPIEHSKALVINRELMQKMVYRTNKDNTKQLEQLKHTVNDLVDKNSELESQIRKNRAQTEKQQRNVPSPSQEVINVKHPAKVSQTPSAFWERSYLSRFHLKMLR